MKVELLEYFGNDLMVVNAARVSYGKQKNKFDDKDEKLINFLVNSNPKHTAPFRHPQLQFRIRCPIYVERQLFKHQVGWSANSRSQRYVDFSDTYELPSQLRFQSKDSKQGSSLDVPEPQNKNLLLEIESVIKRANEVYILLCESGVAKEMARIVLPMCTETEFIWTGSLLAFLHLCNLRLKPDAQKETRDVVLNMLQLLKEIPENPFQYTLKAFNL